MIQSDQRRPKLSPFLRLSLTGAVALGTCAPVVLWTILARDARSLPGALAVLPDSSIAAALGELDPSWRFRLAGLLSFCAGSTTLVVWLWARAERWDPRRWWAPTASLAGLATSGAAFFLVPGRAPTMVAGIVALSLALAGALMGVWARTRLGGQDTLDVVRDGILFAAAGACLLPWCTLAT